MTNTVQAYELIWVALAISTLSQHARALTGYRRERKELERLKLNGLMQHLVQTSIGLEVFLITVQQFFLAPGLIALLRPEAPTDWTRVRLFTIGLVLAGQATLNVFSRWHAWRHRQEIQMAKESHELDPDVLAIIAKEFQTDSGSTLRDLAERMEAGIQRMEAAAAVVAVDLKASEARADAVAETPNSDPGAAADAASQSGESSDP